VDGSTGFFSGNTVAPLAPLLQFWIGSVKIAIVGMPEGNYQGASPNAHLLIGEMPAPAQLKSQWSVLTGGSALPLIVLAICVYLALRVPVVKQTLNQQLIDNFNITWLQAPGPGGGGGGGGNKMPEPARKVELPGKEKATIPVTKPPEVTPLQKPKDVPPPPVPAPMIPAQSVTAGVQSLPGVLATMPSSDTPSLGNGSGTGAGGGKGAGIGPGEGAGLGPGFGNGVGGGEFHPGNGVTTPELLREVKPNYTGEAMRARIQGLVTMEAVVLPDGSVGDVRVTRSLDQQFGLDKEAIKTVKQWRFRPGLRLGQPVPVLIVIEMSFTLR
jgi:protein TonB